MNKIVSRNNVEYLISLIFFEVVVVFLSYYICYAFINNNIEQETNIFKYLFNHTIRVFEALPFVWYGPIIIFFTSILLNLNCLDNKLDYDNKNVRLKYMLGCYRLRIILTRISYYLSATILTIVIILLLSSKLIIDINMIYCILGLSFTILLFRLIIILYKTSKVFRR
jgi:hypothetical protein